MEGGNRNHAPVLVETEDVDVIRTCRSHLLPLGNLPYSVYRVPVVPRRLILLVLGGRVHFLFEAANQIRGLPFQKQTHVRAASR